MESGCVATRPRGTRARDTWKVNVRNIVAEDKRALDQFMKVTAARGSNAFLFPNLIPNGSFEFGACSNIDLAADWYVTDDNLANGSVIGTPFMAPTLDNTQTGVFTPPDGAQSLRIDTIPGTQYVSGATADVCVNARVDIPCAPGDVFLFHVTKRFQTFALNGALYFVKLYLRITNADGSTTTGDSGIPFAQSGNLWRDEYAQWTAPAGAVSFRPFIQVNVSNPTGATISVGTETVFVDNVGCGLLFPAQMYGRTAGSEALPRPVRFSKLPEFSDIGIGNSVKRYGVNFEVTEV
jgi:hypothetical protein